MALTLTAAISAGKIIPPVGILAGEKNHFMETKNYSALTYAVLLSVRFHNWRVLKGGL